MTSPALKGGAFSFSSIGAEIIQPRGRLYREAAHSRSAERRCAPS